MNFSSVSPSYRMQFSMNFSRVGLFIGVQSFRNRHATGSQDHSVKLLQHGLLCPWVHRSCQKPVPAWGPHDVTASFRHIHFFSSWTWTAGVFKRYPRSNSKGAMPNIKQLVEKRVQVPCKSWSYSVAKIWHKVGHNQAKRHKQL